MREQTGGLWKSKKKSADFLAASHCIALKEKGVASEPATPS
jgi:hypothetical protein